MECQGVYLGEGPIAPGPQPLFQQIWKYFIKEKTKRKIFGSTDTFFQVAHSKYMGIDPLLHVPPPPPLFPLLKFVDFKCVSLVKLLYSFILAPQSLIGPYSYLSSPQSKAAI